MASPGTWTRIDNSGAQVGRGTVVGGHTGSYQAGINTQSEAQDDWLITPATGITGGGQPFSIRFGHDRPGDRRTSKASMSISSTSGTDPGDFTQLATVANASTSWTEYPYDISNYAGQLVYLAIRCVSNDKGYLLVDDVVVSASIDSDGSIVTASDGDYLDRISVSWTPVTGKSHYQLYRYSSNDPLAASVVLSWQTGTSYNDLSATSGQSYYYWVKAATSDSGANSSGFYACDTGHRRLAAPINVSAVNRALQRATISWDEVSDASHYRVYRNTSNSTTGAIPIGPWKTGTSCTDDFSTGRAYYYFVKASGDVTGGVGTSDYSDGGPLVIKLVSFTATAANDQVRLNWGNRDGNRQCRLSSLA